MSFPLVDVAPGLLAKVRECQTWEQEELVLMSALPHGNGAMQVDADAPAINHLLAGDLPMHQSDIFTEPIQKRIQVIIEEGRAHAPHPTQLQIMEAASATVRSVQHAHALETARRNKPDRRQGQGQQQQQQAAPAAAVGDAPQIGGRLFAAAAARQQAPQHPALPAPPPVGGEGQDPVMGLDVFAMLAQQDERLAVVPMAEVSQSMSLSQPTPRRPQPVIQEVDEEDDRRQEQILRMMQAEEEELLHTVDGGRGPGVGDDDDDDEVQVVGATQSPLGDCRRHSGSGSRITDYLSPSPRSWRSGSGEE